MKFDPDQPPFWEKKDGPMTDSIRAYKKVRECIKNNEERDKIIKELYEYEFGDKKHLKSSRRVKKIIDSLRNRLSKLDNKLRRT